MFLFNYSSFSQERGNRIQSGLTAGLGIPKIPPSRYRTPVSILGGGFIYFPAVGKFGIQVNGYGLTTFNLGTAHGSGGKLSFDLIWGSGDITYKLIDNIIRQTMLLIGSGYYYLRQQINEDETINKTLGLCLGLTNRHQHKKWSSIFEIRWHLLFQPDPDPQVLTMTFGIIF
jgi:hypothetical protein